MSVSGSKFGKFFQNFGHFFLIFHSKLSTKSELCVSFLTQFAREILQFPCVELVSVGHLPPAEELSSHKTLTSTFLKKQATSEPLPASQNSQKTGKKCRKQASKQWYVTPWEALRRRLSTFSLKRNTHHILVFSVTKTRLVSCCGS